MSGLDLVTLYKSFEINGCTIKAVCDFNLAVQDGDFIVIVGKSGCGKTTLLRLICGLEDITDGAIVFTNGGKPVPKNRTKISIVFQEPRLMPWLTVKQNMAFSFRRNNDKKKADRTVHHYLKMLGLDEFKNAYPAQISGGMAQRAALGRTLCFDPDIILMDEPFGALDAFTRRNLQNELVNIFQKQRKTIIFVTHDVDEAVLLGHKVLVMEQGRLVRNVCVDMTYPRNPMSKEFYNIREDILETLLEK